MKTITNFSEAHAALRQFYAFARTKYDLELMRRLMAYLGNPQDKLRVVHVAGTSGKTSTAYYTAALLQAAGFKRVGLTVSPHVDEVNERVQIDLTPLPEAEFCSELQHFLELIGRSKLTPSYFEVMVAFAYWVFAKRQVDYAVVEVGLGGLLDGTNVIARRDKVCIITDIGLDHTEVLGETIGEIAAQKAGIIQPGNEVFMYEQDPEVLSVVRQAAARQAAQLRVVPAMAAIPGGQLPPFQQRNLGLAVQAVNFAIQRDRLPALTDGHVQQAAALTIPARMERFTVGNKILILDGSHNAQKLGALVEGVRAAYPEQKVAALVAFVEGPAVRWQGGLSVLLPIVNTLTITSYQADQDTPKRSVGTAEVQRYCKSLGFQSVTVVPEPTEAFKRLLQAPEPVLLVAGSFYLLTGIRPLAAKSK